MSVISVTANALMLYVFFPFNFSRWNWDQEIWQKVTSYRAGVCFVFLISLRKPGADQMHAEQNLHMETHKEGI